METETSLPTSIETFPPQALAMIADLQAQLVDFQAQFIGFQTRIAELEAQNKALRDQLGLNSRNSSLPPSSDKGRGGGLMRSLRVKSERKPGGQKGHAGSTLKQVETPDRVEVHDVAVCSDCGTDLTTVAATKVEKRQIFELPPPKIDVIEHQSKHKVCPECAKVNRGVFPADVTQPVQYGPRFKALTIYLQQAQLLPYQRTALLFKDVFGHSLSQGTVLNLNRECHRKLAAVESEIKSQLQAAATIHCDETGFYELGKRHWLHVVCNKLFTYYFPHPKRLKRR